MMDTIKAAIEEIEAQIAAKEAEILPLKDAVNRLYPLIGKEAPYSVDGLVASARSFRPTLTFRPDQFYNRALAACVTEYFETRESAGLERTASVEDIYDGLVKGGYKFEAATGTEENKKIGVRTSLTKNTAQFCKVGDNLFGLKKWYPSPKTTRKPAAGNGASSEHQIEVPTEQTEEQKAPEQAPVP